MPRLITERCVEITAIPSPPAASPEVLELTRALAPYLAAQPADVVAALAHCGIDRHLQPIAR